MKRWLFIICALVCACTSPSPTERGGSQRIVSLKPNITEILFALGVGDRVVGVTTWCHYPPAAQQLPKVADYLRPFSEKVVAVRPDLVISSEENSDKAGTMALQGVGIPVHYFPFRTIEETAASIRAIGALVGKNAEGEKLAAGVAQLKAPSPSPQPSPKGEGASISVVAVVGYRPLIVVGPGTFLSDVIAAAGLRNIVTDGGLPYPQLSMERLLALDPDLILDMTMGMEISTNFWKKFPQLRAVQRDAVHTINMDEFHAGPRLPEAVAKLKLTATR